MPSIGDFLEFGGVKKLVKPVDLLVSNEFNLLIGVVYDEQLGDLVKLLENVFTCFKHLEPFHYDFDLFKKLECLILM